MGEINLDEMLAPSGESQQPNKLIWKGEEFELPAKLPIEFIVGVGRFAKEQASRSEAVRSGAVVALADATAVLFDHDQWQRLMALRPDQDEFIALVNALTNLYTGGDLGEVPGSAGSSESTSTQPTPTSNGSTESTSPEPSVSTG